MPPRLASVKIPYDWGRKGPFRFWRIFCQSRAVGWFLAAACGRAGRFRTQPGGVARRLMPSSLPLASLSSRTVTTAPATGRHGCPSWAL